MRIQECGMSLPLPLLEFPRLKESGRTTEEVDLLLSGQEEG